MSNHSTSKLFHLIILLLVILCFFSTPILAQSAGIPTESCSETIQDTFFSNNHQLSSFQYVLSRYTHDPNANHPSSPNNTDPFVYFPQQIYDLFMNTGITSFDYASTQGQWDTNAWGNDYTGIYNHLDWENVHGSFCTPLPSTLTDSPQPQSFHSTSPLHHEPQPHAGKLHYSFIPLDHDNDILTGSPHSTTEEKKRKKIEQTHTAIASSISNLFCSALSQITFDSIHINQPHSIGTPINQYDISSYLPIESLCTEHIVSLRRLLPIHSMIPSSTTIFHSNYVSFRVTTRFYPSSNNNSQSKNGRLELVASLVYVKNITPNDQTHIKTTNIATTTKEMHEIPDLYSTLHEEIMKSNTQFPPQFKSTFKPISSDLSNLGLSAFLRPHRPNRLYLQHQAYLHPSSSKKPTLDQNNTILAPNSKNDYNFGAITHSTPILISSPTTKSTLINSSIIQQLVAIFNPQVMSPQQIASLFTDLSSSSSSFLNQAREYDIINAQTYLTTNHAIKSAAITNIPRWMCLFAEQSSTTFTTPGSAPPFSPLNSLHNTCSDWIISLFDPTISIDTTKPHFLHPTLPNIIQIFTTQGVYTLVIHREAYLYYLASNIPTIFLSIYSPSLTHISTLSQLYHFFSTNSINTLSYTLINTNPISTTPHRPHTHQLMYPSAHSIQFLSPSQLFISDSPYSKQLRTGQKHYFRHIFSSLLSTLLSNNNSRNYFEKLYIQSHHHLYWNLLSLSTTTAVQMARDSQQFQQEFLKQQNHTNIYWPLFNSPCSSVLFTVNAYNSKIEQYVNNLMQYSKDNGRDVMDFNYQTFITFTPRPMKDSLFFCQFYSLLPKIVPTPPHQSLQLIPFTPESTLQFYPTKYALFPHLQTTRHFSSLALDTTEFVINIEYTPGDVHKIPPTGTYPNIVPKLPKTASSSTQSIQQPVKSLKLVRHQSIITWKVGDIFFDQIQISGRYSTPTSQPTNHDSTTAQLSFFESVSSYFSNPTSITPIEAQFVTRNVNYQHNTFTHSSKTSQNFEQCDSFNSLVNAFEFNDKSSLHNLISNAQFDPRCIHLSISLGQSRSSPTTITSYFLIDHNEASTSPLPTYRQVFIKIPIQKALFRVSESHTDIARGIDIFAGETNLIIMTSPSTTHNETELKIRKYTTPTTNTSMLVPYPDASMPFNATAIVSTLVAFTFGNLFTILFNSDHDFMVAQHSGKITRILRKFRQFRRHAAPADQLTADITTGESTLAASPVVPHMPDLTTTPTAAVH